MFLLRLVSILSIVATLALLVVFDVVMRLPADLRERDLALWLYTPHVAPGDTLRLGVEVWGGKRAGIERLRVSAPWQQASLEGEGKTWGGVIVGGRTAGTDEEQVELSIPAQVKPGDYALAIEASYVIAERSEDGFSNHSKTAQLTLPIRIESARERTLGRLASGAFALGVWLAGTLAFRRMWPKLLALWRTPGVVFAARGTLETRAARFAQASFGFVFPAFVLWCLAGWLLIALPLGAALALHSTALSVFAQIAWLLGAPLVGRRWAKRDEARALKR